MDNDHNAAPAAERQTDLPAPDSPGPERPRHIALFFGRFGYGGPPQTLLRVGAAFAEAGHRVDCVTSEPPPADYPRIPESIRVIPLRPRSRAGALYHAYRSNLRPLGPLFRHRPRWLKVVPDLTDYLCDQRPDALFAALHHWNMAALVARASTDAPTRIILSLRMHIGRHTEDNPKRRARLARQIRLYYPRANGLIVPSLGVAEDVAYLSGFPVDRITVSPNPAFPPDIDALKAAPAPHPWLEAYEQPVILGAGRIAPAKGFDVLIRAFACIRERRPARLIIIGGATESYPNELERLYALAQRLGVGEDVSFPGYTSNPFAYMARANLFVLSSNREGFANVIVESLACGCPVVSTDCPAGPSEILDGGRYGRLVPVNEPQSLAEAAMETMDAPPDPTVLRARAAEFSPQSIARQWLSLLSP